MSVFKLFNFLREKKFEKIFTSNSFCIYNNNDFDILLYVEKSEIVIYTKNISIIFKNDYDINYYGNIINECEKIIRKYKLIEIL